MSDDVLAVSERYLQEMLEADDTADYALYTKRYEGRLLDGFSVDQFQRDIAGMHERNGMNRGYAYLATLRSGTFEGFEVHRTVWKGEYEKRDAVIEFGVYQRDGVWYVIQSSVH